MKCIDLSGRWLGRCTDTGLAFDGNVPGCVHRDLINAGVTVPDIYRRDNADSFLWIEKYDWEYERSFVSDENESGAYLVFECLDTYADIYLNGVLAGHADDMFITHRFKVDVILKPGENHIKVHFYSPIKQTEGLPERPHAFTYERLYTRRMQCTYGWDWTGRFVTCGISGACRIEFNNLPAVEHTYIYTDLIDAFGAQLVCLTDFKNIGDGFHYNLRIADDDGIVVYENKRFCREEHHREYISVANPRLWSPLGHGEQHLYTLTIDTGGDITTQLFGIRTVRVLRQKDAPLSKEQKLCERLRSTPSGKEYDFNIQSECFTVLINGKRVFCKGADWAPSEPFVSDVTDEKLTALLELAAKAGVNMIRVWGGGTFEKQHFYNECDRLGIMVAQDFLMACGNYPEDDKAFTASLAKETRFAAYYLRNHPCLVWWNGDNENAVNGSDTQRSFPGRIAAVTVAEPILMQLDPARLFLPSSPYGGDRYACKTVGTTHNTQFLATLLDYIINRDMTDYKDMYKEFIARFIAEEPSFGAASTPSLQKMMDKDELNGDGKMWYYHTKTNPCLPYQLLDYAKAFASKLFGDFTSGDDRIFKLQYLQYEWIRTSFEMARRNMWFCGGILYWMLADCWPAAAGWSLIDYYKLAKASYYSFKRCAGSVIATCDGGCVYICNDSEKDENVCVKLALLDCKSGEFSHEKVINLTSLSGSVISEEIGIAPDEGKLLTCDIIYNGGGDRTFYKRGAPSLTPCLVRCERSGEYLTVSADCYVHAVRLEGNYVFSDNWFSLYPGETKKIKYESTNSENSGEITAVGYTLK